MRRREFLATIGTAALTTRGVIHAQGSKSVWSTPATNDDSTIPSADELAGQWMSFGDLHTLPALSNTLGGAQVGADLLSVEALEFPPFCQGGSAHPGQSPTGQVRILDFSAPWGSSGSLKVNGDVTAASEFRWYPYKVLRRASIGDGNVQLESAIQLAPRKRAVMWRLDVKNLGRQSASLRLEAPLRGMIRKVPDGWTWYVPRPDNPHEFQAALIENERVLVVRDSRTATRVVFAFGGIHPNELTAKGPDGYVMWDIRLAPGQTGSIEMIMATGDHEADVVAQARADIEHFSTLFDAGRQSWQEVFDAAFKPGNPLFSGHLPTLQTQDADIRRVYYMSVASLLAMFRQGLPVAPHAYITASPQFGASLMYFWDTFTWATVHALLDPVDMKNMLRRWLKLNIHSCYAQDMLTGRGVGPWYSFNDFVVFNQFTTYMRVTGDSALLMEQIGGRSVMEQLEQMALWWKRLVKPYSPLADYGASWNLLECVPTYTHVVASLNAANVWMMRQAAELLILTGQKERADKLRAEADRLAQEVLKLYVPGKGYWNTIQPDGRRVPVRHCIDLFTVSYCMAEDLSSAMKREMTEFAKTQLLTDHWMRALSLEDPAAPESNRPDHGPMGAYDAWPPYTMEAMCRLGDWSQAVDFLRRCAWTTHEGPYGQSHELLTTQSNSPVHKAFRGEQMYNASCAGAFAEIIIRNFFGFQCDHQGAVDLYAPGMARGFTGSLNNLHAQGRSCNIRSEVNGLLLVE